MPHPIPCPHQDWESNPLDPVYEQGAQLSEHLGTEHFRNQENFFKDVAAKMRWAGDLLPDAPIGQGTEPS